MPSKIILMIGDVPQSTITTVTEQAMKKKGVYRFAPVSRVSPAQLDAYIDAVNEAEGEFQPDFRSHGILMRRTTELNDEFLAYHRSIIKLALNTPEPKRVVAVLLSEACYDRCQSVTFSHIQAYGALHPPETLIDRLKKIYAPVRSHFYRDTDKV